MSTEPSTELTEEMIEQLKRDFCVYARGPLDWVFAACCEASQSGGLVWTGRERRAARTRLTEWLSSEDAISTARSVGFVSVAVLQARVRELEDELAGMKTCGVCDEPATYHVCRHHCHP